MEIAYTINLDRYDCHEIIDMVEIGAITVEEVEQANVYHRFFTNLLRDYIEGKKGERIELEPTILIRPAKKETVMRLLRTKSRG